MQLFKTLTTKIDDGDGDDCQSAAMMMTNVFSDVAGK